MPEFQDNDKKDTLAMWLTKQYKLVPRQWIHDYNIKNKDSKTLKDLMIENYLLIPQHWKNEQEMTIFDKAYFGIIPDIKGHKPNEQDKYGFTVAMILAENNINIPEQWYHDPNIQNNRGNTVAQLQAFRGKIPDKQWEHRSDLQQNAGVTLAMRLTYHGFIPPKQWEHNHKQNSNQKNIFKIKKKLQNEFYLKNSPHYNINTYNKTKQINKYFIKT